MTFGLRCSQPARRPHPASLPFRVPTVESLLRASFGFPLAATPCASLRLSSSTPSSSFRLDRFCPCWAQWGRRSPPAKGRLTTCHKQPLVSRDGPEQLLRLGILPVVSRDRLEDPAGVVVLHLLCVSIGQKILRGHLRIELQTRLECPDRS